MDLSTLVITIAVLACPIGMGVMMWVMNKNMRGSQNANETNAINPDSYTALLVQRRLLDQRIAAIRQSEKAIEALDGISAATVER